MTAQASWSRKSLLGALKPTPDYYVEIAWQTDEETGKPERCFYLVTPSDTVGSPSRRKLPSALVVDLLCKITFRQEGNRIYFRPWLPPREAGSGASAPTPLVEQPVE